MTRKKKTRKRARLARSESSSAKYHQMWSGRGTLLGPICLIKRTHYIRKIDWVVLGDFCTESQDHLQDAWQCETPGTSTTGGLRYCQTAKSEAIFLTMLVHKNQARKHLKRDVPNLVLWEHLILSIWAARRRRKKRRTEGEKKRRRRDFRVGKNAVKRRSRRFFLLRMCRRRKESVWKSEASKCSVRTSRPAERPHAMDWRRLLRARRKIGSTQKQQPEIWILHRPAQPVSCTRKHTAQPTVFVNERQAL